MSTGSHKKICYLHNNSSNNVDTIESNDDSWKERKSVINWLAWFEFVFVIISYSTDGNEMGNIPSYLTYLNMISMDTGYDYEWFCNIAPV